MRITLGVCAVLLAACGRGEAPAAPPPTSVAPPPTPPALPRVVVFEEHVASFVDDKLDECLDAVIEYTIPPGEAWVPPTPPRMFDAPPTRHQTSTTLRRPCTEQFAGRTALATCTMRIDEAELRARRNARDAGPSEATDAGADAHSPPGTHIVFTVISTSFNFKTALDTDARMRECMEGDGEWTALAEDSDEYRRARLEQRTDEVRNLAERYR